MTNNDINAIIKGEKVITRFMDDEYSKEDIGQAFEKIKKEICYNENDKDNDSIGQMYLKLKEHCRISDTEIAKLLGMKRTTLNTKLKKLGLKSGVM